ncbi:MAG: TetR/AcrR family transcriptional regulator [Saprospiraceae bacterium]|nr:TetR/AcrR family transcriptional regulator [Saprospiraceae bacterium]MCB0682252.1 TetR/AcrR family transcriptional regulator [Saprospiraceae bacterium]
MEEASTEIQILEAARQVFTQKGFAAARMQEIADRASINKGLLHYYFRSKEKLFLAVFEEAFQRVTHRINEIFEADLPLFEKIEAFVHNYLDTIIENPYLPGFVVSELNRNPTQFLHTLFAKRQKPNPTKLMLQIQQEVERGRIRPIHPVNLVLNILSMCIFPFVARPLFQSITEMDDATYFQLMKMRKKDITEFVLNAIRLPETN